jgi:hypothetical protein
MPDDPMKEEVLSTQAQRGYRQTTISETVAFKNKGRWICVRCGSVVLDPVAHDGFHDRLESQSLRGRLIG